MEPIVTVDLSRSVRGLLDGAVERARQLVAVSKTIEAAKALDEAARLSLNYANYATTPSEKKRRIESAVEYRAQAEQLRSASSSGSKVEVRSAPNADESESEHDSTIASLIHVSSLSWNDIAGLDQTKRSINSAYALSLAQAPAGVKLAPVRNVLFYGPPGCGKSLMAAATSNGLDATFFNVKVSSLLSKYFGESPKLVTALYDMARQKAPSVVFMDEVDALAANRDSDNSGPERRVLANLLSELDGVAEKGSDRFVLTIAATNAPWMLDAAVLSRFERKVYIPLPDAAARRQILEIHLIRRGYEVEASLDELAQATDGMSGREIERTAKILIEGMISDANPDLADLALQGREAVANYKVKIHPITRAGVATALSQQGAETSSESLARYKSWDESH